MSENHDWMTDPNQDDLPFLQECIAKGEAGIKEWNEWREANPGDDVWLQCAKLPRRCFLNGIDLSYAFMQGAHLHNAQLQDANLFEIHLEGAELYNANLTGASLPRAHLSGSKLVEAVLRRANLQNAELQKAELRWADLREADLRWTSLQGADFKGAFVDGKTWIWTDEIDRATYFAGVGLASATLRPGLKQTLEYNVRLKHWRPRLRDTGYANRFARGFGRLFWWVCDYGRSTRRILRVFFGLALAFAMVYFFCGLPGSLQCDPQAGIIQNLFAVADGAVLPWWVGLLRSLYFSIVTMTTLGFGNMYAAPGSILGHATLIFEVLIGYTLLGALICRFSILFQSDGPPVLFVDEKRKRDRKKKPTDE